MKEGWRVSDEAAAGSGMRVGLKRNGEKRIDQPAVEDHDLFGKTRLAVIDDDVIVIAAGGEQRSLATMHDARHDETCLRLESAVLAGSNECGANHVPIPLRLVDVGLPQRTHAVAQHGARGRVDHAERQATLEVLRGGDAVAPLLDEKVRPRLELVVVDRLSIAGVEVLDFEFELDIHGSLLRK